MSGASLGVPGLLYVGTSSEQELAALHVGPAVGWVALKGLHTWSREISVVFKADLDEGVRRDLAVALPEAMPEAAALPNARRAAAASVLVAVDPSLVEKLVAHGVRVHTIGSDRITGGFYYFAKGGPGGPVRAQGNLVEMVAPALAASADNAALEASMDGVIDRTLAELSEGRLSEAQIELAAALPTLGEPAAESAVKLQTLEGFLVVMGTRAARYEERARAVVATLGQATRQAEDRVHVPLFGDARRVVQPELQIEYAEGEAGTHQKLTLPERSRWFVAGLLPETMPPPAVVSKAEDEKAAAEKLLAEQAAASRRAAEERAQAEKVAAEKVAAEKAAAASAAADKAAAAKAAAEKAAKEKAAADRLLAEKAAAEKAAAERAAVEKARAEKAAAEKAAAEKAAAEKAAAEKLAAEKAAAEKAAAEKAAAEKAAAEKAAAEKIAAEKTAIDKAAAEKAAAEKAAARKAAADKAAAEKSAADKAAAAKAAEKKKRASAAGERAKTEGAVRTKADDRKVVPAVTRPSTPMWVWLALVAAAAAGAYYLAFVRHHG